MIVHQNQSLFTAFIDLTSPDALVVEVGSRLVSPGGSTNRVFFPNYIGFDLYKDENTDITGDAHKLSQHVPTADAIFSLSTLEHLAAPWLFALEVAKVLKPEGLTFHQTHFHWPEHEMPWDFYRFSDQGLAALFCPAFGFEVLAVSTFQPCSLSMLDKGHQEKFHPGFSAAPCWGGVNIIARKVSEPPVFPEINLKQVYPNNTGYPRP